MYSSLGPPYAYQGQPVQVFPFWPNYRRDFVERWEWKTDILTSYNGSEQRMQLRSMPRRILEFEVFARAVDRSALENFIWRGQEQIFAIPDWNRGVKLSSTTLPDVSGRVAISPKHFLPGGFSVGFLSPTTFETRPVVSVDGTGITLDGQAAWVAQSTVYPLLFGRLTVEQSLLRVTGAFTFGVVTFELLPAPNYYSGLTSVLPVYKGYPIMSDLLDWSGGSRQEFSYKVQTFDSYTASPAVLVESETPATVSQGRWFLHGTAKLDNFLGFLHQCQGRTNPFWFPSNTVDLIPVGVSASQLTVQDSGYTSMIHDRTGRSHIHILKKNGTSIYCKILDALNYSNEVEVLTLDDPLIGLSLTDIKMVSFMSLARMGSDRSEVAYKGPIFATSVNSIRTLKHDI